MQKIITAAVAAAVLLPLGAQAEEQKPPSRVWAPSTEVRTWHGHQYVLLPAWQSEQAALGRDDTSGHIP